MKTQQTSILRTAIGAIFLTFLIGAAFPAGAQTNSILQSLPGLVESIPAVSNWVHTNMAGVPLGGPYGQTNGLANNNSLSASNMYPIFSNWYASRFGSTNWNGAAQAANPANTNQLYSQSEVYSNFTSWLGTNQQAAGTNAFQNFTNWLAQNPQQATNFSGANPVPPPTPTGRTNGFPWFQHQ